MRVLASLAIAVLSTSASPLAQTATPPAAWSFSAAAYSYLVPDDRNYVQPTFTADRGKLHLEARYNYEGLDTGSAWVGYNFGGGGSLAWDFTPMIAGVFGALGGVAPGYKGSLRWWKLELYSEGEHVFDMGASANSFTYNWSELTLAPLEWFRFGLATQRTYAHQSGREIQDGALVSFTRKNVDLSAYVFNPGEHDPTFAFAVGLRF